MIPLRCLCEPARVGALQTNGYLAELCRSAGVAELLGMTAGVDQALVFHFLGSKEQLFAACLQLPFDVEPLVANLEGLAQLGNVDEAARQLTRFFLELWERPETGEPLRAMDRAGIASGPGLTQLRAFLQSSILTRVARALEADSVPERVELISTHLLGLALTRHIVTLPEVSIMNLERLVAWTAPEVRRYLTGPLPERDQPPATRPGGPAQP